MVALSTLYFTASTNLHCGLQGSWWLLYQHFILQHQQNSTADSRDRDGCSINTLFYSINKTPLRTPGIVMVALSTLYFTASTKLHCGLQGSWWLLYQHFILQHQQNSTADSRDRDGCSINTLFYSINKTPLRTPGIVMIALSTLYFIASTKLHCGLQGSWWLLYQHFMLQHQQNSTADSRDRDDCSINTLFYSINKTPLRTPGIVMVALSTLYFIASTNLHCGLQGSWWLL